MIKYDYKRLFISGDFYTLLDGEELKNDHPKFEVISSKTAFYSKLTYRDIPDYTNIRNRNDYDILRGKFGDNYQSWGEIVTEEISYEWSRRNNEILKATELFEQYKLLLSQGYRLYSKENNLWMFELAYEQDYIFNEVLLEEELKSQKLQHKEKDFKIETANNRIKKLVYQQNEATQTIDKLKQENIQLKDKTTSLEILIDDYKESITRLNKTINHRDDEIGSMKDAYKICENRANHLEESIDSVTNDNLLLRNEVRILQIKLDKKKKGWFK